MSSSSESAISKAPQITLLFWLTKIIATTLGETGGDAVTMTLNWGYLLGTALFAAIFVIAVAVQIKARRFHPALYWFVIIATTTCGTTLADFCDRSLGIGYPGGSLILFSLLLASLGIWYWALGSVSVDHVTTPKTELFYWATIMFSQTLGTAAGDWMADTNGMGYGLGALVFSAALAVVVGLYFFTNLSRTLLFWVAFILTRPLGATVGDLLDKPLAAGGLDLGRFAASAVLVAMVVVLVLVTPRQSPATAAS